MRTCAVPAVALILTGCSAVFGSGTDVLARVEAAPVPDGARQVSSSQRDGDFERGPEAVIEYGLPQDLATACPLVLNGLADAGYELLSFTVPAEPVTDIAGLCDEELADSEDQIVSVVVTAVPPDLEQPDGFGVVLVEPNEDNPFPTGTTLRYDA